MAASAAILTSNLSRDGERRPFHAHGHATLGNAGGAAVLHAVFEPGWRWSADVAPLAGTDTCQVRHLGYVLSGTMTARFADGSEQSFSAGDLVDITPGHDAWVVGDEPVEFLDFSPEATKYAAPADVRPQTDPKIELVKRGYAAFNAGDEATLRELLARDVTQHVPGTRSIAGTYKGIDAVLGYYAKLAEITDGTIRADLIDVHGDGAGHALAYHQESAVKDGRKRVMRVSILFTFVGDKATDLLEMHADMAGDDAFYG